MYANGLRAVCVLLLLPFGSSWVNAQSSNTETLYKRNRHISIGVRIGLNQLGSPFRYQIDKFLVGAPDMNDMYYHAGVFVRKDFKHWFVQPELIISQNVVYMLVYNSNPLPFPYGYIAAGTDFNVIGITAPLQAGVRPTKWLSLMAGPSLHWHFYENELPDVNPEFWIFDSIRAGFRRASLGVRAGVRLSYKRLSLEVMYENRTMVHRIELNGRTYPFRVNADQYIVSAGFVVFKR